MWNQSRWCSEKGDMLLTIRRRLSPPSSGAQAENNALSNFNIDWQNQQLQRQVAGLSGVTGAYEHYQFRKSALQPINEAAQNDINLENIASQAQTQQNAQQLQSQEFGMSQRGSLGTDIGNVFAKGCPPWAQPSPRC